jgi:hypothetical protein
LLDAQFVPISNSFKYGPSSLVFAILPVRMRQLVPCSLPGKMGLKLQSALPMSSTWNAVTLLDFRPRFKLG